MHYGLVNLSKHEDLAHRMILMNVGQSWGYFELTDLKAGKWRLRAQKSVYKGGWPRFVDVSPTGNYEENFTLFRLRREKINEKGSSIKKY